MNRLIIVMMLLFTAAFHPGNRAEALELPSADTRISIDCVGVPAENVLKEIGKKSGLNIVYRTEDAKAWPSITIKATDASAEQVIKEAMDRIGVPYSINNNIVTIGNPKSARVSGTVKGVILDEEGNPLPGANVMIDGSQTTAVSDVDGLFSINVNGNNPVLRVSYVGMRPYSVALTQADVRKPLSIELQVNSQLISDIVVTGYQEVKKEKMTGSVATLSADKLDERHTISLLDNLEGRVAGLSTYGGKPVIRGTGTLYGSTSPLLVVDGLPVESSIDDINPYDIESVTVLKDAAASAIYGARAANGILVVTTKNARNKGKIDIGFSADVTMYENVNVDYADNFLLTPSQQVDLESDYYNYYFFNNNGDISDATGTTLSAISSGNQISPVRYAYYRRALGEISDAQLQSTLSSLKSNDFARDYADAVYRRQVIQQYNLSLRGSTDVMRNNLVINYKYDNTGIVNSHSNWLNLSYKGSYDLAKWLTATVGINGIHSTRKQPGNDSTADYTDIWSLPAYTPFYNNDGTPATQYYSYSGNPYWTLQDGMEDLGVNILNELRSNVLTTRRQNLRLHADLLFRILPGLSANAQMTYEVEDYNTRHEADNSSHVARSLRNGYAYTDGDELKRYVPDTGGLMTASNTTGNYWTARGQLNYSRTFFGKHDVAAIAGLEFRDTKRTGTSSLAVGYDDQLQVGYTAVTNFEKLSTLNYSPYFICGTRTSSATMYPVYTRLYSAYFEDALGFDKEVHHRYASGYANLTYTYDSRYNIFGSYRKDYADVYGLNDRFRGQPLWSIGAGWNAHNESFLHDYSWLNFLKLRFSYGVTGNIYQGANSFMTASTGSLNPNTNEPQSRVESPANPYLRWEQNRTTNFGVDYSFLGYRLRGSIDIYNKSGKDIFARKSLDPTSGFSSMNGNVASIRNRGVELSIAYDWFRAGHRSDFAWTTSVTFARNKNVVTNVETPAKTASEQILTPFKTGYPVSALWSYRFAGVSDAEGQEGLLMWYSDQEGSTRHKVSTLAPDEVLEYSGQRDPKVTMGMDNTFRWNGLSLGVTMVYYGGHQMRALAQKEVYGIPDGTVASYFSNAWTPENPTSTPGIGRYGAQSNASVGVEAVYSNTAVYDADFIKIRNVTLSYDFPRNWMKYAGMQSLQLRFQLNDPKALWTKNKIGVDPETLGLRSRSSYVFGLNVNF